MDVNKRQFTLYMYMYHNYGCPNPLKKITGSHLDFKYTKGYIWIQNTRLSKNLQSYTLHTIYIKDV